MSMSPNGRRAWRRAAKKLRRTMGRRWRSQQEWVHSKRWSELVPDLEAHRAHIAGSWFKRHGVTEQGLEKLDAPHLVRVYVGLWGTVDGDYVTYAVKPEPFTTRSIVGMSQSSRKRKARAVAFVVINSVTFFEHAVPLASALHERLYRERGFPRHSEEMRLVRDVRAKYRIGECLRPCPGCCACGVTSEEYPIPWCDGSGVLPTRTRK